MPKPGRIASVLAGFALAALAAGAVAGDLKVVTPRDGDVMPPGKALMIGSAAGGRAGRVEIDVNGSNRQAVEVRDGVFRATVRLAAGRNVLNVSAGEERRKVTVVASAKAAFAYHGEVEKCAQCHGTGKAGYAVTRPVEALCLTCHSRVDQGRQVHGPVASGDCTSCHDPHASAHPKLTRDTPDALCTGCHDQKSSEDHLRKSKAKRCTTCHDPHSAAKVFLLR